VPFGFVLYLGGVFVVVACGVCKRSAPVSSLGRLDWIGVCVV